MLKHRQEQSAQQTENPRFIVQMPGAADLIETSQMWSGGVDATQEKRLGNISHAIPTNPSTLIVKTNAREKLSQEWEALFKLFSTERRAARGKDAKKILKQDILIAFNAIPATDPIKKALLAVHSLEYVQKIMELCIDAQSGQITGQRGHPSDRFVPYHEEVEDVALQPHTFEVLIRDFATTVNLFQQQQNAEYIPPIFSIGLPTHHAFRAEPSGFCIFNKVAMLIEYFQQPHVIIAGLDVNADNGLRNCLSEIVQHTDNNRAREFVHYDIYDSRVWPKKEFDELNPSKKSTSYHYHPVDLKDAKRQGKDIHPVLSTLIAQIEKQAQTHKENLGIYIALGWDSHQGEEASCGRVENETEEDRQEKRFTDKDFAEFYEQLITIKQTYNIPFLYIGLEGGYTPKVYEKQCQVLTEVASQVHVQTQKKSRSNKEEVDFTDMEEQTKVSRRTESFASGSRTNKDEEMSDIVEAQKKKSSKSKLKLFAHQTSTKPQAMETETTSVTTKPAKKRRNESKQSIESEDQNSTSEKNENKRVKQEYPRRFLKSISKPRSQANTTTNSKQKTKLSGRKKSPNVP